MNEDFQLERFSEKLSLPSNESKTNNARLEIELDATYNVRHIKLYHNLYLKCHWIIDQNTTINVSH